MLLQFAAEGVAPNCQANCFVTDTIRTASTTNIGVTLFHVVCIALRHAKIINSLYFPTAVSILSTVTISIAKLLVFSSFVMFFSVSDSQLYNFSNCKSAT